MASSIGFLYSDVNPEKIKEMFKRNCLGMSILCYWGYSEWYQDYRPIQLVIAFVCCEKANINRIAAEHFRGVK